MLYKLNGSSMYSYAVTEEELAFLCKRLIKKPSNEVLNISIEELAITFQQLILIHTTPAHNILISSVELKQVVGKLGFESEEEQDGCYSLLVDLPSYQKLHYLFIPHFLRYSHTQNNPWVEQEFEKNMNIVLSLLRKIKIRQLLQTA